MAYDLHADYHAPSRQYITQQTQQPPAFSRHQQQQYVHPRQEQFGYDSVPGAYNDDYSNAPHDQHNGPRHAQQLNDGHHARQHPRQQQQQQQQHPQQQATSGESRGRAPAGDSRSRPNGHDSQRRAQSQAPRRKPLIESISPDAMPISQDTAFPVFPTKKAVAQEKIKANQERSHSRPAQSSATSRNQSLDNQSPPRIRERPLETANQPSPPRSHFQSLAQDDKRSRPTPEPLNLRQQHQDRSRPSVDRPRPSVDRPRPSIDRPRPSTSDSAHRPADARFGEAQRLDRRGFEPQGPDHRGFQPQKPDHRGHEAQRFDRGDHEPQRLDHRAHGPQTSDPVGYESQRADHRGYEQPQGFDNGGYGQPQRPRHHELPDPPRQSPPRNHPAPSSYNPPSFHVSRPSTSDGTFARGQAGLPPLNTTMSESAQFNTVTARHQPAVVSPSHSPQEARISRDAHISTASYNDELALPSQPWDDQANKHQSLGDVYDHYYSEPAPMNDREAEIEAAMPDFDKPAPHKRQDTVDKDLANLNLDNNHSAPPPKATYQQASAKLQAANPEFDFGFGGSPQRSATVDDLHSRSHDMAPNPPQHSYSYDDAGVMPGMSSHAAQYDVGTPYGGQSSMPRKPTMPSNDSGYADQHNYNGSEYNPHSQMYPSRTMPNGAMPHAPPPNGGRRDPFPGGPMPRGPIPRGQTPSNQMRPNALPGSMPNGPQYRGPTPGGRPPQGMPVMPTNAMGPPPPRHGADMRAPSAPPMQGRFAPPHSGPMNGGGMSGPRFAPDMRAPSAPPTQGGYPMPARGGHGHMPHPDNSSRDPRRPMPRHPQDQRAPSVPPQAGLAPPDRPFGAPLTQQRSAPQVGPGAGGRHDMPSTNPNALPGHPVPVRPGLNGVNSAPTPGPAPVRRHNRGNSDPPSHPQAQVDPTRGRPSVEEPRKTGPVTRGELDALRSKVEANPNDNKTALFLAKRLVEAAVVLAPQNVDPKTAAKNSERYVLEAHKRVKKLVAANYSEAMFYLADCYGSGDLGLSNDPKQAFALYQAAAKAGHGAAAYRTAFCCEMGAEEGGGTKRDYHKAVQWYQRAAQLQDVDAMYKMGIILLRGLLGQQRNVGQAVAYLKRAVDQGDSPHAMHELARLHEAGNPDPAISSTVRPDERYAHKLYAKAAKMGHKNSQYRIGQAYEYGSLGLPVDSRNSIAWYSKAAAQGQHDSELALSGWYLTGAEGILEQSDTEAYLWARKAATSEPPLAKAMYALGYYVENGIGCSASLEEAKRWYSRAASYKFPKAIERLEEIRRGKVGRPQPNDGRLTRSNQKRDEAECVMM